jgi:acyl-CoA reductase-like NAD-dependent aldehyde dehydrogenase
MVAQDVNRLGYLSGGRQQTSAAAAYFDVWNPSTGAVIAQVPDCPAEEVELAVESARKAFRPWADTPPIKRVQVLYRFRELLEKHLDELTRMVATEHGKVWEEAQGDVLKAKEVVEVACGIPSMLLGESMMNAATGYDTVLYREPLGVFVGISPFNFPAMIPMGWMMPLCIATGNTLVLRPSPVTPLTSMRIVELLYEAGLPEGVVNLVTCGAEQAERLIAHPAVKGVMFVGSTRVGQQVYENAARNGKRVQALCQAKNHALVMEDAPIERSARGIINGASLVLDGRGVVVDGYEQGFYLGPCIFDHVKPGMSIGEQEIFGPVLCVKRVKSFDEGVDLINANPYANGSVIFTQNGYYSREFARRADAGMVGINVGIPVPVSVFPFSGHKQSFFGDLHTMGKDGIRFFTQVKSVTSTWFNEEEMKREKVDTWDGML